MGAFFSISSFSPRLSVCTKLVKNSEVFLLISFSCIPFLPSLSLVWILSSFFFVYQRFSFISFFQQISLCVIPFLCANDDVIVTHMHHLFLLQVLKNNNKNLFFIQTPS